jgi:hypothetical protein
VSRAAPSGVVARVTLATVVLAREPLTRYAIARAVEARFGSESGPLRTKHQGAYDQVPGLERAGLIHKVGMVPARPSGKPTGLWAATRAGVETWRGWLTSPIAMPDAMTEALSRLYAVRPGDYATMVSIIDRLESVLQRTVHDAVEPDEPEAVADRIGLLWNRRQLVAQLQWCQHARDIIQEAMTGTERR